MFKSELGLKKAVKDGLEAHCLATGKPFHWQNHEDARSVGIPDTSYAVAGFSGWIEFKYSNTTMPDPDKVYRDKFEIHQEAWLIARGMAVAKYGSGNTFLVHGYRDCTLIMPHEGLMRRDLDSTFRELYSGGMSEEVDNKDFGRLYDVLCGNQLTKRG